jgi:ATP-dependent Clp protease ATP-binding subunit ClpC
MFERFTDRARRAMTLANQEAQRLGHDHIGTEHLLLGLLKEGNGTGAIVLKNHGVDLAKARQQVEQCSHGPSTNALPPHLPHSQRYRDVLDTAIKESEELSCNYVGTEHVLLGLLNLREGTAARVLAGLGLNHDDVRNDLLGLLGLLGQSPGSKEKLLEQAMKDLAIQLADEQIDPGKVRAIADALITAGWRPQQ